jgi:hypothetical protein
MKLSDIQIERLQQSASHPGRLPPDAQQHAGPDIVEAPTTHTLAHESTTRNGVSPAASPVSRPALVGATVDWRPASRQVPDWKRPLRRVVTPIGGAPMRTLSDARDFIVELPKGTRQQEIWDRAADLLIKAAESGRDTEIEAATFKVECALLLQRRLQRD